MKGVTYQVPAGMIDPWRQTVSKGFTGFTRLDDLRLRFGCMGRQQNS